jgi:hypothetical protein
VFCCFLPSRRLSFCFLDRAHATVSAVQGQRAPPPAKLLGAWAFGPGERQRLVSENGNLTRNLVPLQRVYSELCVPPFVYMCHDLGGGPAASFRLDGVRMAASLTRAMGLRCRI